MPKESKRMLKINNVATSNGVKERSVEVPIKYYHSYTASQNGKGKEKQQRSKEYGSAKQR
jgi:hypothetical protein